MQDWPRSFGFSRIKTRRTASSAVIASPARIRKGRTSSYFHSAGTQGVFGLGGTSACSTSHSGVRLKASMSRYSCSRTCLAGIGAFMGVSLPLAAQVGPIVFEGRLQGSNVHLRGGRGGLERQVGRNARGLAHHEAGARHARGGLRFMAHGGASSGDPYV